MDEGTVAVLCLRELRSDV